MDQIHWMIVRLVFHVEIWSQNKDLFLIVMAHETDQSFSKNDIHSSYVLGSLIFCAWLLSNDI